jgi:hypothetical protein
LGERRMVLRRGVGVKPEVTACGLTANRLQLI